MKKPLLILKALAVAVVPYLLHATVTFGPGAAPHIELPPLTSLAPLLEHNSALLSTLFTWYELAVRLVPTSRNRSLVVMVGRMLESLVPNRLHSTDEPAS